MSMKRAKAEDFDILQHAEEYARASGDPTAEVAVDHLANLMKLREMLIRRRRYLVQDAIAYPIAYMGRSLDLSRLQPVIVAIEEAIEHEKKLAAEHD